MGKINDYCKEHKIYPNWINKKKENLIVQFTPNQICGIESFLLQTDLLYKFIVISEKCKIFTLEKEKFFDIASDYKEAKIELVKYGKKKIDALVKRLYIIKKSNLEMFEKRN